MERKIQKYKTLLATKFKTQLDEKNSIVKILIQNWNRKFKKKLNLYKIEI